MNRMTNQNVQYAWNYHDGTKHSYQSIRTNPHFLDWANRPRLFKIYPSLPPIPLPKDTAPTGRPALSVISLAPLDTSVDAPVSIEDLASVLYYSVGLTRRRSYSGGEIQFRAAACTGALYSVETLCLLPGAQGSRRRCLYFQPFRLCAAPASGGRLPGMPGQGRGGRSIRPARPCDSGLHRNLLAQRLEVSGAHVAALLMGRGHPARQPARRRNAPSSSHRECPRLDSPTRRWSTCWVSTRDARARSPRAARACAFTTGAAGHRVRFRAQARNATPLAYRGRLSCHARAHAASSLADGDEVAAWKREHSSESRRARA